MTGIEVVGEPDRSHALASSRQFTPGFVPGPLPSFPRVDSAEDRCQLPGPAVAYRALRALLPLSGLLGRAEMRLYALWKGPCEPLG